MELCCEHGFFCIGSIILEYKISLGDECYDPKRRFPMLAFIDHLLSRFGQIGPQMGTNRETIRRWRVVDLDRSKTATL